VVDGHGLRRGVQPSDYRHLLDVPDVLGNIFWSGLRRSSARSECGGIAAFLDASAHSNRAAWYVPAGATVVAVTAACLLATPRRRGATMPLVFLGQLALTAYLAHIIVL